MCYSKFINSFEDVIDLTSEFEYEDDAAEKAISIARDIIDEGSSDFLTFKINDRFKNFMLTYIERRLVSIRTNIDGKCVFTRAFAVDERLLLSEIMCYESNTLDMLKYQLKVLRRGDFNEVFKQKMMFRRIRADEINKKKEAEAVKLSSLDKVKKQLEEVASASVFESFEITSKSIFIKCDRIIGKAIKGKLKYAKWSPSYGWDLRLTSATVKALKEISIGNLSAKEKRVYSYTEKEEEYSENQCVECGGYADKLWWDAESCGWKHYGCCEIPSKKYKICK